jgi:hypothetical protein
LGRKKNDISVSLWREQSDISFRGCVCHPASLLSQDKKAQVARFESGKDPVTARDVKLYLCCKHSGGKLGTIGAQFGIGDAAVAQSYKRFKLKLQKDRKLRQRIERFEKRVFLSNLET